MVPRIRRPLAIILLLLLSNVAFAADVELRASWTKGKEHWLVHIQVARPGFFIAPNSPAFDNQHLIQITDAATRQPVDFRLRHEKERMLRSIDLAFPQLQKPMNVFVSVGGIVVVDQKGRRVAYQQDVRVQAPVSGEKRERAAPSIAPFAPGPPPPTPPQPPPPSARPSAESFASPPDDWVPTEVGQGLDVGEAPPDALIPQFPFPPPQASAFDTVPRELLVAGKTRPKLKDVDATLSAAFRKCGYGEKSFYAVPDGFAMASRLEQINADGSFGANRWSMETAAMSSFSIESYLSALFKAREGHFRVVVFVVTNHPFEQTDAKVSSDEAKTWVKKGLNELPKKIGDRDFTNDYVCTALIYEFKTLGGGEAKFVEPSEITGQMHLQKSGLLSALAKPR